MFRAKSSLSRQFVRFNHRISFKPDTVKGAAFRAHQEKVAEHARGTMSLWRNISYASLPLLFVCAYFVFPQEVHHIEHMEELCNLPDEQWPPEMDYQNVRNKKFIWGDKSLFWGPCNHMMKKE